MTIIRNVKFQEINDFRYHVTFVFDERNLVTAELERSATRSDILAAIRDVLHDYNVRRSSTRFNALRTEFEQSELNV